MSAPRYQRTGWTSGKGNGPVFSDRISPKFAINPHIVVRYSQYAHPGLNSAREHLGFSGFGCRCGWLIGGAFPLCSRSFRSYNFITTSKPGYISFIGSVLMSYIYLSNGRTHGYPEGSGKLGGFLWAAASRRHLMGGSAWESPKRRVIVRKGISHDRASPRGYFDGRESPGTPGRSGEPRDGEEDRFPRLDILPKVF